MKRFLILFACFYFCVLTAFSQTSRINPEESNYTGKRYDGYGKPLKNEKKKLKTSGLKDRGEGSYKNKSYPIGMDKVKRKKKANFKGRKKKKSCNCPGH